MKKLGIFLTVLFISKFAYSSERALYEECPAEIKNRYECSQYIEKSIISNAKDRVTRVGDSLKIKLDNGKTKEYKNARGNYSNTSIYSLVAIHSKVAVVEVHHWEESGFLMIHHKSGEEKHIEGIPVFSPSGNYAAASEFGAFDSTKDPQIGMYKINKSIEKQAEFKPSFSPSNLKWINDNKLELTKNVIVEELMRKASFWLDGYSKKNIYMIRKSKKWEIVE